MAQSFYDLDPWGDVVLVLELEEDARPSNEEEPEPPPPEKVHSPQAPPAFVEEPIEAVYDPQEAPPADFKHSPEEIPTSPHHNAGLHEVRIRVSSKHLRLASLYFDKMFEKHWLEGYNLGSNDCVEVPMHADEGLDALLIILNIIHGHTREVPRSVDLSMLTKLAVLVDFYDCHEAVEVFSDMWIDNLKHMLPTTYSENLIRWLCISWVFRESALFKSMTQIAQLQSNNQIDAHGLPIPSSITDMINLQRENLIDEAISTLHHLLEVLQGKDIECSFECDSMNLGALTKQMKSQGLLLPRPEPPFPGLSFEAFINKARNLKSPSWSHVGKLRKRHGGHYDCAIESQLIPIIGSLELEGYMAGLDLDNFPPSRARTTT